jgi:carbonic anhydrase
MRNKELLRLVAGFRRFRGRYFQQSTIYRRMNLPGWAPKTLIIACADSRVDPAIVTSSQPGELFTVRNIANLVPPYETNPGFHGVSSAIEFAVINLKVENIIIMGHRQCGGIRALVTGTTTAEGSFVSQWMKIAQSAKDRILQKYPNATEDSLCRHCEMESIVNSLENLRSFPFVEEAVKERNLTIIGAYFDLENGHIYEYDQESKDFRQLDV